MSIEDSNSNYGDVMDGTSKGPEEYDAIVLETAGHRKIRGKLLWSFMIIIALTLLVIAITLISQTYATRTINELVQVHSKIARLSLETENTLRLMEGYEKDFLLQYERVGAREAEEKYLAPFMTGGGQAYKTLSEIQSLASHSQDIDAAQAATDFINEYLSAFVDTVTILAQRLDEESGELFKLQQTLSLLGDMVQDIDIQKMEVPFNALNGEVKGYLVVSDSETLAEINEAKEELSEVIKGAAVATAQKTELQRLLNEFDVWFARVMTSDEEIAVKISGYQDAVKKAELAIKSLLAYAVENEAAAVADMEDTSAMVLKIILAVGIIAILFAIYIAVRLSRGLTDQVDHIMGLLEEMEIENYEARAEVVSDDELGVMAVTLNSMLDNLTVLIQSQDDRNTIQESIMKLLEEISTLSDGDFTSRAEVTEDVTGAIADSFNAMADQFSDIISKVKVATKAVGVTSEEVSRQTMGLAEKNIDQVKGVATAVEAIDEMVASIKMVSENAQQSATVSKQSRVNAQEGAKAVNETNKAMSEIREEINETARSVKRLGESSLEIGNIVQIIDDIADRTSILALNASIQAAMAGDAGHGFAVVADEVQRLADSSSNSTKQIEILVKSIQAEIKDLTTRIDESISKVVAGSQLADGAHDKLQEIEMVSGQLAELIEAITGATNNQVKMSKTISKAMEDVGEVSRESSLSTQDTAASMNILSKTARDLRSAVDVFKISEEETA